MSKAIFLLTPATKDDGSDYNLYLSLEAAPADGGVVWNWWLPQQFGYARTDTGTCVRDPSDSTTLLFTNGDGNEGMKMQGVNAGGATDFPFSATDQANRLAGALMIEIDNTYLKVGSYTWTVDMAT